MRPTLEATNTDDAAMTRIANERPLAESFARVGQDTPPPANSTLSRQGESLADIASRTGTTEPALRTANPALTPFDALPMGTAVTMPAPAYEIAMSDPVVVAGPEGGNDDTLSPHETLEAIEDLPEPHIRDLPPQLPDDDRRQILQYRQDAQDARILEMAETALADAEPPQLSDYASLPLATAQAEYQMALDQYNADLAELRDIVADIRQRQLEADPAFQALPEMQQQAIIALLRDPDFQALPMDQQQAVLAALRDPAFQTLPADQQQAVVAAMLAGEYYITGVSMVENHGFHSGDADAVRFDILIDGESTPVFMPVETDPTLNYHGLDEVASGLVALEPQSRERIERVDVNAGQNPADAYWEQEYNMPGFRSYMTAGVEGIVSIYPTDGAQSQSALDGGLQHEVGHIVSKQEFGDTDAGWAEWEAAMEADGQSVSDYADASRDEDFAETYKLYMSVIGTPEEAAAREQFPERFAILDEMTGNG